MIRRVICLFALTVAAAAQPAGQGFSITGRVIDDQTGKPLNKISVSIGKPLENEETQRTVTAADGRFSFSKLSQGKYWLVAEGRGVPRQSYQQHGFYSTAIAVGPQLDSSNIEFKAQPDGSISGVISDQNNEGIRDAQVMLFRRGLENGKLRTIMQEEANTNDEGRYHFSHVQEGTYFIVVVAKPWFAQYVQSALLQPGFTNQEHRTALNVVYPLTYYPGSQDASAATPISVKSGDRVSADMTLTTEPAQQFKVTDPDSGQGQGMNILLQQRVFDNFSLNVPAQVVESSPGQVQIAGVPEGRYRMQVQSYGKQPRTREQEVSVSDGAEVRATGSTTPTEITGIVRGLPAEGEPVIRLTNAATGDVFDGEVEKKGQFHINAETLSPGKYQVELLNVDRAVVKSVSATGARASGQTVEISPGGPVRLIVTLAEELSRVDGVARRDGKGVGGAMIVLVPQDLEHNSALVRRDQSDSDGTFSLYAVPAGKYTVIAIENGWELEWQDRNVLAPYLKNGTPIDVGKHKGNVEVAVQ